MLRTPPSFRPAPGLANPHLQTLWGPLGRRTVHLQRQRERLWLADGDFLDLDWHASQAPEAPLVLVLHGLTGSSNSPYVAGLQRALAAQDWGSVAVNWRGCSGEPNLLPRSYHSGATEDLVEVIGHVRRLRPEAPLYAVGYSLGGNILLKHLGESGAASLLRAAVAVSVPFRLDQCADRIAQGFSKVYQAHFMRAMLAYISDKQERFELEGHTEGLARLAALGSLKNLRNFWDFDGTVTAPLNGFADAHDYYRRSSSRYFLPQIQTRTLIIQAADDPFVFPHSLPTANELSASTTFELQEKGGHVGFVDGRPGKLGYYLERRIPQWLAEHR
ncbi:hydrolase [Pseudomonas sp. HR96]|nr:hydrolase [Pseudomonas sp. HR96]WPP00189.1 hydrolase [Pseudomonas sp. HR96]